MITFKLGHSPKSNFPLILLLEISIFSNLVFRLKSKRVSLLLGKVNSVKFLLRETLRPLISPFPWLIICSKLG